MCGSAAARRLWENPDYRVRAAALRILSHRWKVFPEVMKVLEQAVADENAQVRLWALAVLADMRKPGAIETVVAARPDVFNHNLETVPRLYPTIRPGARYFTSLRLLARVKEIDPSMFTKSGLMVGLGETRELEEQLLTPAVRAVAARRGPLGLDVETRDGRPTPTTALLVAHRA